MLHSHAGSVGYLAAGGEQFALRIRAGALEGGPVLHAALSGHADAIEQRLRRNENDTHALLMDIAELLDRPCRPAALPSVTFYELLVRELDAVGWSSCVCSHTATRAPNPAAIRLARTPPDPAPITKRSTSNWLKTPPGQRPV